MDNEFFLFQSTNGIKINAERIAKNVFIPLHENDIISFVTMGRLQYRFVRITTPSTCSMSAVDILSTLLENSSTSSGISPEGILSNHTAAGVGSIDHVNQ